jgi:hypothetical protein
MLFLVHFRIRHKVGGSLSKRQLSTTLFAFAIFWLFSGPSVAHAGLELSESFLEPPQVDKPTPVKMYLYLDDVNRIDVSTHTYEVTAQLVMEWQDARVSSLFKPGNPESVLEFEGVEAVEIMKKLWHPEVEIMNERGERKIGVRALDIHRDGRVSVYEKFDSQAHLEGDMFYFPFTVAELRLAFNAFEQDKSEMELQPAKFESQSGATMDDVIIGPWSYLLKSTETKTTHRSNEPNRKYSRVDFLLKVRRDLISGISIALLPILLIWVCSSALLWIDAAEFSSYGSPRIGGLLTLLLTCVTLQLTMESRLPSVSYLTLPNLLFYETIVLLTAGICLSVVYVHRYHRVSKEKARTFDRTLRITYPIVAVTVFILALIVFAFQTRL